MPLNVAALTEVGRLFDWQPDPARYFATDSTEQILRGLQSNLMDGHGVLVLTGEAGAGKTLLARKLLQKLQTPTAHIAQLTFTAMTGDEIASSIAYAFGMPPGPSVMSHQSPQEWTQTQLEIWAHNNETCLLVVDEAQSLPPDALRILLDLSHLRQHEHPTRHVVRILLVGQPGLIDQLDQHASAEPANTFGPRFNVPALTAVESAAYVENRLSQSSDPLLPLLTSSAIAEIHRRTQGWPGHINLLCLHLLHSALLLESTTPIDVADVTTQADELSLPPPSEAVPPVVPMAAPVCTEPVLAPARDSIRLTTAQAPAQVAAPVPPPVKTPVQAEEERQHLAPPPRPKRAMGWLAALLMVVGVAAGVYYYAPRMSTPQVSVAPVLAPPPAPAVSSAPAPEPVQEAKAAAPVQLPASSSSSPSTSMTEELPDAQPLETATPLPTGIADANATTKGTTNPTIAPASTLPVVATLPAAPPKAPPQARALATQQRTATARKPGCTSLLTQISLGEPLTAKQRRYLEANCR